MFEREVNKKRERDLFEKLAYIELEDRVLIYKEKRITDVRIINMIIKGRGV